MGQLLDRLDLGGGEIIRPTLSVLLTLTGGAAAAGRTFDVDALALAQDSRRIVPAWAKCRGAHLECITPIAFTGTTTGYAMVVGITGNTNAFLLTGSLVGLTAGQKTDLGGLGALVNRLVGQTSTRPALEAVGTVSGGAAVHTEVSAGAFWLHLEYDVAAGRVAQS
jgi:hypothetical protein